MNRLEKIENEVSIIGQRMENITATLQAIEAPEHITTIALEATYYLAKLRLNLHMVSPSEIKKNNQPAPPPACPRPAPVKDSASEPEITGEIPLQ